MLAYSLKGRFRILLSLISVVNLLVDHNFHPPILHLATRFHLTVIHHFFIDFYL